MSTVSSRTRILLSQLIITSIILGGVFVSLPVTRAAEKVVAKTQLPAVEPQAGGLVETTTERVGLYFEENHGQQDGRVKYLTRGGGHQVFLTATQAVYVLMQPDASPRPDPMERLRDPLAELRTPKSAPQRGTAVYMTLAGADRNAEFEPARPLEHRTNYFIGNVEQNWHTDIPNYRQVTARGIYNGIDTVWHGNDARELQYDFIVAPNADPSQIEWQIDGARNVSIDTEGDLIIDTDSGKLVQQKPVTFQEADGLRSDVESSWQISETRSRTFSARFNVGTYDRTKPLTIDPSVDLNQISYSTMVGGALTDTANSVAIDNIGNSYVVGYSNSVNFPVVPGSYDESPNGLEDIFVSKFTPNGMSLVFSSFIGGSSTDVGRGIEADSSGNVYFVGYTESTSYPGVDIGTPGNTAAVVSKLSANGSQLTFSYRIGGSGSEIATAIALDTARDVYICGSTTSSDFPLRLPFQGTNAGNSDGFVTKISSSGRGLIYSTFLGGSGFDTLMSIAVDSSGNSLVTGGSDSLDFPTTNGTFNTNNGGGTDVFISKLTPLGSSLSYSTYIGGSGDESAAGITLGLSGQAIVCGTSLSSNYPTAQVNGYFRSFLWGGQDIIVTEMNSSGSNLSHSGYFGGSDDDGCRAIRATHDGRFAFAGTSKSQADYPISSGPSGSVSSTFGVATKTSFTLTSLPFSRHIKSTGVGSSDTFVNAIAEDSFDNLIVVGESTGTLFETAEGMTVFGSGGNDGFLRKYGDFSISGRALTTAGVAIPNAAIGMSGDGDGFQLTDAFGNFYFGDTLTTGTYLVSGSSPLFSFNPSNYTVGNMNRNKRVTFVGNATGSLPAFANLGGRVSTDGGSTPLANTKITLVDTVDAANTRTSTTNASGDYTFTGVQKNKYYRVYAQRDGYGFEPGDMGIAFLSENMNLTFAAKPTNPRPVGDFDGDGKADLAVFRPSDGTWYIQNSRTGSMTATRFGLAGDVPVSADLDGDKRSDITVFRPSDGNWYWLDSSTGQFHAVHFGLNGDVPVAADYDGDGRSDLAVFRPADGIWHILNSSDGSYRGSAWGMSGDKPFAADLDGDKKADLTVYRNGTWYRMNSRDGSTKIIQFGNATDRPFVADMTGDGWPEVGYFRPSKGSWSWLDGRTGVRLGAQFGIATDVIVPSDHDGDGRREPAVYRNGEWYIRRLDGTYSVSNFGLPDDIPVNAIR